MGKTKNRRYRKKNNPTGLASVKSIELEDDERESNTSTSSKHEHVIQTVLQQMEAHGVDLKICGLNTVASMTEFDGFVEELLNHNVVRVVGPMLVHPNSTVREAAAIALRNMSGMGMPEICDILVDEDVLTYVFALFDKYYSSNWLPCAENGEVLPMEQDEMKSKRKAKRDKNILSGVLEDELLVNTFTQGVHVLWNLCKSSDLAVKIFNQQNVLSSLSRCLDPKECGIDTAVAVAHCLQTITENNDIAAHELKQNSEEVLLKILSPAFEGEIKSNSKTSQYLLLRILAAGIVMNITKGAAGTSPVLNLRIAMTIKDAISEDHRKALSVIHDCLSQENGTEPRSSSPGDEVSTESMSTDDSLTVLIDDVTSLVMAQTIAIELLTNLYYKEDEDDDWVDSDCEDLPEAELLCNDVTMKCGLPEVEEVFGEEGNIANIFKKVEKDDLMWERLLNHPESKILMSRVSTLRSRALLCLQNIISSQQDEDLGSFTGAFSLWEKLGSLICKEGTDDVALLEAATGAMRAISERIVKMDPGRFAASLRVPELQMLLTVEAKCSDPKTRVNVIRTIGIMGEALSHSKEESCQLLGPVGSFLLQVSMKADEQLWVVAEALDALMDVFAEDSTDQAAVQIGLVNTLKSLLPSLRFKLRQQRKSLGHHAAIVATANTNLERFIEYKINHISNATVS